MVVWLFKDGESLPVEPGARRMRMGMLAHELARRGHEVHWFSSTFLHLPKKLFAEEDRRIELASKYYLHLIHAGGFRRNFSLQRYRFYRRYARRLRDYCEARPRPDVIVCAFPLVEVAAWVVDYARARGLPVAVDVRDLWPDAIVEAMPRPLRGLARLALELDFRRTSAIFAAADSVCAMSEGVLDWALGYAGRTRRASDRVIPIGYPQLGAPERRQQKVAALLANLEGRPVFVYAGTFGHTYRVETIIAAARLLQEETKSAAHFVLVGDGPRRAEAMTQARSLKNVTFTGWLEQAAVRSLLAEAAAGLLPWAGRPGAMPNKFFDYLAAGLPVVSSAEGELNQRLRDRGAGETFAVDRPADLVRAVEVLAGDRARRARQAASAKEWFESEFAEPLVYRTFADHVEDLWKGSICVT